MHLHYKVKLWVCASFEFCRYPWRVFGNGRSMSPMAGSASANVAHINIAHLNIAHTCLIASPNASSHHGKKRRARGWSGSAYLHYNNVEIILDAFVPCFTTKIRIFPFPKNASSIQLVMIPFYMAYFVVQFQAILRLKANLTREWEPTYDPYLIADAYTGCKDTFTMRQNGGTFSHVRTTLLFSS